MKTLRHSVLAGAAALVLAGPASAALMETFSFTDVLSYNDISEAAHDTRNPTSTGGGVPGGYTLDSIVFDGDALAHNSFLLFLQQKDEMAVEIKIGGTSLGNLQLGSGAGNLSVDPVTENFTGSFTPAGTHVLTSGTVLDFIFNEIGDTWAAEFGTQPNGTTEFDAKWTNITFQLQGTAYCTTHPSDPICANPVPEPATLALLGLGLLGLGAMRRR